MNEYTLPITEGGQLKYTVVAKQRHMRPNREGTWDYDILLYLPEQKIPEIRLMTLGVPKQVTELEILFRALREFRQEREDLFIIPLEDEENFA